MLLYTAPHQCIQVPITIARWGRPLPLGRTVTFTIFIELGVVVLVIAVITGIVKHLILIGHRR